MSLPSPGLIFPPDRGRSPLRLPKAHVEGKQDEPGRDLETCFSLETCAAKPSPTRPLCLEKKIFSLCHKVAGKKWGRGRNL